MGSSRAPSRSRGKPLRFRPALPGQFFGDIMNDRPEGGQLRAIRRLVLVVLWTLMLLPVQLVLIRLPGRAKHRLVRFYHAGVCRLIGMKVQVVGEVSEARPTLFVSNHSSWLDIIVLGSVLEAAFVSKAEVNAWPGIGLLARLSHTVFVSRSRGSTGKEADAMRSRLAQGDSLILFPEGTSNDGGRVLPFRSSFLAVSDAVQAVQPVSLVYDRLANLPACRRDRPLFAWYGDMDIASHFWRLARRPSGRATVLLHHPVTPGAFANRKQLTEATASVVADGAALLRQNRAPQPLFVTMPAARDA
ncbi:1-acyl-sn-glycerol-3-phosphate acyltransferase [Acetobacteraceae bacterium H6797]|nr:1-acyl-sn-glycerol-3-phosphate acyltransferase [Acetobacteraceae bacterium H6797]